MDASPLFPLHRRGAVNDTLIRSRGRECKQVFGVTKGSVPVEISAHLVFGPVGRKGAGSGIVLHVGTLQQRPATTRPE